MERRLCVLLFAAALSPAQTQLVVPQSHAAREGTTSTNVPFGRSTPARVQCLYESSLFTGAGTITAIAFRLDGDQTAAAKQVECEIRMSTSPLSLVAMAADFASNRGADEVVVLPRQIVTLPAMAAVATPSPFLAPVSLAVPFPYDPAFGPLLVEITVFAQPPGAYSLDATFVCDSPEVALGPPACVPQIGQSLRVESATTQLLWGRPWVVRALDAPAGAAVLLALADPASTTWNGAALPVALDGVGAPGCFVAVDAQDLWLQVAQPDGTATFTFGVPNQPSLLGASVAFQAGAFAPSFNQLGLATSQAKRVAVCGFEPVGRLWSNGITATVGVREVGTAPVLRLSLQ